MSTIKQITRNELYELVWSKPLTTLSKNYAYSDNGLRKICKKYNVPLPNSGYWSKIKFNKKVEKTPLPNPQNNEVIELIIRVEGQDSIIHPNSEIARIKNDFILSENFSLNIPSKLIKPHELVIQTKDYYLQKKGDKNIENYNNHYYRNKILSINVSYCLLSRALIFLDTLIKAFEKHGCSIQTNDGTVLIINEQSYKLRLIEKHKRIMRDTKSNWPTYDLVPTGKLSLKLDTFYPIKEWFDTPNKKIEQKLLDIIAWIEFRSRRDRGMEIEHQKRREEQEKKRVIEEIQKKNREKEILKFKNLLSIASRWEKSQSLRKFIVEVEKNNDFNMFFDEKKDEFLKWADEKLEWYDPLIEKEVNLLKGIDRNNIW